MGKGNGGSSDSTSRQLAMVINLDKCLGCHTCSIACKTLWTSGVDNWEQVDPIIAENRRGKDYMWWNNVETKPGKGYPKDWENMGGGFDENGNLLLGELPTLELYGPAWKYDYETGLFKGGGIVQPEPEPKWGPNWEEDEGEGTYPNSYYFYLPRLCNHCTKPACLEACPRKAIYKREEDGIVLIDQERCRGYRYCVRACPYKKPYYNPKKRKTEKCIFCYPRIEKGVPNACAKQCPGRIRAVGYLDDTSSVVYKLVKVWEVALPLHPEYGTGPNVYYIPPFSGPPQVSSTGVPSTTDKIPIEVLRELFGDAVDTAIETLRAERQKVIDGGTSELMELLQTDDMFQL
jgi:dimethylsulfide dehydrogenase subunit beta/complex iron-sulfur molybdoenzyme family reductase subunit beta